MAVLVKLDLPEMENLAVVRIYIIITHSLIFARFYRLP